jgi:hypothetical protein
MSHPISKRRVALGQTPSGGVDYEWTTGASEDRDMRENWSAEREREVLGFFRQRSHAAGYLASSRCPRDGRLLGAISRLPDGVWIWIVGSRLAPEASRQELRSGFLDTSHETEWTSEIYEQASQYADEEISELGRVGWEPAVMKIVVRGLDRSSPW